MNKNDIRVTYAVDQSTVKAIDGLARDWSVSKSEAMRRAVRLARERLDMKLARMTPLDVLDHCETAPTRTKKEAKAWQAEARGLRKTWRSEP